MKTLLIDLLVCPNCLPHERKLGAQIAKRHGDDILSGSLACNHCGAGYPIQDGIASLLPSTDKQQKKEVSKYENSDVVSSYLWSHFGDLLGDIEASTAYADWVKLMENQRGFFLDAGCAVGRFTFEMSIKSDFAVGIDNSLAFIRAARTLKKNGQLEFLMREEGLLTKQEIIRLAKKWNTEKVEFILGDAQALPFHSNAFSSIASLNLIDKVPLPLMHLKEMNRVAKERGAQFLFSDPFSWSQGIAKAEEWLGGTLDGPYGGKGIDNIFSLLTGKKGQLSPPWRTDRQGHIWWKIRTHRNHFELIRSCFIKASR